MCGKGWLEKQPQEIEKETVVFISGESLKPSRKRWCKIHAEDIKRARYFEYVAKPDCERFIRTKTTYHSTTTGVHK